MSNLACFFEMTPQWWVSVKSATLTSDWLGLPKPFACVLPLSVNPSRLLRFGFSEGK